jgi:hypothetical protein
MAFRLADFPQAGLLHAPAIFITDAARPSWLSTNRASIMLLRLYRFALIFALSVLTLLPFDAGAQVLGQAPDGLVADQQKVLQQLTAKTDDLEKKIQQDATDDAALVEIRLQLQGLSQQSLESALAFRSRTADINKRLEQLGPVPAEGQPAESDIVATER